MCQRNSRVLCIPVLIFFLAACGETRELLTSDAGAVLDSGAHVVPDSGNPATRDRDGDGVPDAFDVFPDDPTEAMDSDRDGVGNNADNCPFAANADQRDVDGDGVGCACDPDADGDGLTVVMEAQNGTDPEKADSDGDGVPDATDEFPLDSGRSADSDRDRFDDREDNCPLVANHDQKDTDGDGMGDACDPDSDADGLPDAEETAAGTDPLRADTDSDGVPDGTDAFPLDHEKTADADRDGLDDRDDNCPLVANVDQVDTDGDKFGDACDPDADNDGLVLPLEAALGTDPLRADTDGDGVADGPDAFPLDPSESRDADRDGKGDNKDNCPRVSNPDQTDVDADGMGDACDPDSDNDGLADAVEAAMATDPRKADTDGDGMPDGLDAFPLDPGESADADRDGIGNKTDNCPFFASADQGDLDGDGVGDACDPDLDGDGLTNAAEAARGTDPRRPDTDGDGATDQTDNCPALANTDQKDTDGDGAGDACDPDIDGDGVANATDAFPLDPAETADADGDAIGDHTDNCPVNANPAQTDTDSDREGNACDPDDDNDGVADLIDAFPLDPAESADTDLDGVGDRADPDDDNDGSADAQDGFPKHPGEWLDTDGDGIGNNADPDDDNDGLPDLQDPFPLVGGTVPLVIPPPDLNSLNQTPVPEPPQLGKFVKNKAAAVRLGKALFWDMQVGSDGVTSCATCHFSAGADNRRKNQLSPGLNAGDTAFGNNRTGGLDFPQFGPNHTMQPADYPLHERSVPADVQSSSILRDTNDVVSSQGVRLSQFVGIVPGSAIDDTSPIPDPVFNHAASTAPFGNTRRVEPRNTPTVINAVFNFTNFWDGRANFMFNGENPFGPADPNAGVWFNDPVQGLVKRPVEIQFASLASQAVGPPLSDFEMSARGRTFPMIGRKLLSLEPLGKQQVHPGDSVLGALSNATVNQDGTITDVKGLNTSYRRMIRDAFENELWDSGDLTPDGFLQIEANFAFFFGLAVQLYEATLVSDQTPFDRWLAGDGTAMTDQQKLGFAVFSDLGNCTVCHIGIELTTASVTNIAFVNNFDNNTIELMAAADGVQVLYDDGFINSGITPNADDIGRGGTAPFTNPLTGAEYPLSYSALAALREQNLLPFETPILPLFVPINTPVSAAGGFKVPGLRNVELTAPYFHNGSVATLDEVIDFYVRGGNFPAQNIHDLDPIIGMGLPLLQGDETKHAALVAFMKALTDPRVAHESAPFDHPELFIPEGDPEVLLKLPARDADGNPALP